jgi:uncharacterized protein
LPEHSPNGFFAFYPSRQDQPDTGTMGQPPSAKPRLDRRPRGPQRRLVLAAAAGLLMAGAAMAASPAAAGSAMTIIVVGDSQAQGVAGALQRLYLRDRRHYHVLDRSKIGTGLITRANFNWPEEARDLAVARRADIAVVMFGANDRPPFHLDEVDPALKARFQRAYGKHVRDIVRAFRDAGMEVVWLGHPMVRDGRYAEDMAFLNQIYRQAATEEGARWLPLWDLVTDGKGGHAAYGKGVDGETRRLRANDGVHFTSAGYDLVVSRLQPLIAERHAMLSSGATSAR